MEIDRNEFEKQCAEEIKAKNLKVLQCMDDQIEEIIYVVSYCSLHELDRATKIWHACETVGPLFLVKRKTSPTYKLLLLNQKSPNDYDEEIYTNQKFELNEAQQFIFMKTRTSDIKGLWISSKTDMLKLFELILKCGGKVRQPTNSSASSSASTSTLPADTVVNNTRI